MRTNTHTEVEYLHRIKEDIGETLKAGIILRSTSSPIKQESYSAFDGLGFALIPAEKVQVYKRTTTTIVEVEEAQ